MGAWSAASDQSFAHAAHSEQLACCATMRLSVACVCNGMKMTLTWRVYRCAATTAAGASCRGCLASSLCMTTAAGLRRLR